VVASPRVYRRLIAVSLAAAALAATTGCDGDVVVADARDCRGLVGEDCDLAGSVIQAGVESDAAGQQPMGRLRYWSGFGMSRGRIDAQATCLDVSGNTAIIGWTGTISGYLGTYYKAGLARLRDLGPRDSDKDTFEFSSTAISETPVAGPTTCSSFPGPFPNSGGQPESNEEGDVVVFDAPVRSAARGVPNR
jgi:hypothetical protein